MKYLLTICLSFGLISPVIAQECANGNCHNAGRMVPMAPRPQSAIPAPSNTTYQPPIQGPAGPAGKDGKDGKDFDPALLKPISESLAKLDDKLQNYQTSQDKINERLANLEKVVVDLGRIANNPVQPDLSKIEKQIAELGRSINTTNSQVNELSQQMAGSLRVRFKYDPKTDSLTRVN